MILLAATQAVSRTENELREAILEQTARVRKLKVKPEIEEATRELVSLKEEYKTVTGSEWSDLREEGPILLTTNKVRGREVLPEFREMVKQLRSENLIRFQCLNGAVKRYLLYYNFRTVATILIISGTHGTEDGVSGLTNEEPLDHFFYVSDCEMVGVKKGPSRRRVPIESSQWNTKVPMITKPAEKLDPLPPGCFYRDDVLKTMDIRVGNMAYYHGHSQKLLNDIMEVNLTTFYFT